MLNESQRQELERLVTARNGIIKAADIVEFAKDETTALHDEFEWDDAVCGVKHREQQARGIIRAYVIRLPGNPAQVRGLVSVPSDRTTIGAYRRTKDVVDNPVLREQVVEEALNRIAAMRDSFAYLPELKPLWDRIDVNIAEFRVAVSTKAQVG